LDKFESRPLVRTPEVALRIFEYPRTGLSFLKRILAALDTSLQIPADRERKIYK
jgi:hypothetical protein